MAECIAKEERNKCACDTAEILPGLVWGLVLRSYPAALCRSSLAAGLLFCLVLDAGEWPL